jgi:hypothetical protein
MKMPKRVQRRRAKGWQAPEDTVYVGRPTKWGNPFIPGQKNIFIETGLVTDKRHACCLFRAYAMLDQKFIDSAQRELRGKDLMCWCRIDDPSCHGDVLLEIANR